MLFEPEMLEAIEPEGPPGLLRIAEEVIKFVPTAYLNFARRTHLTNHQIKCACWSDNFAYSFRKSKVVSPLLVACLR